MHMGNDFLDEGFEEMDWNAWKPQRRDGGGEFQDEYPEPDDYVGVVAAIYDIGIQVGYMNALKDQVAVVFELDAQKSNGYPHVVIQKMTKSMYEEAPLYKLICAAFPNQSHVGLKLRDLIGQSVYGTVTVKPSKSKPGKCFVDFRDFKKVPRGMAAIAVRGQYDDPPKLVLWMASQAIAKQDADKMAADKEQQAQQDAEAFDA